MQQKAKGGFSKWEGDDTTVLHTFVQLQERQEVYVEGRVVNKKPG